MTFPLWKYKVCFSTCFLSSLANKCYLLNILSSFFLFSLMLKSWEVCQINYSRASRELNIDISTFSGEWVNLAVKQAQEESAAAKK